MQASTNKQHKWVEPSPVFTIKNTNCSFIPVPSAPYKSKFVATQDISKNLTMEYVTVVCVDVKLPSWI